jgi:isoleucyl-tRNA synthetase
MNTELSAFYFDISKDTLYCEPYSSVKRRAALTVIDEMFNTLVIWLAPILSFTAEEAWLARDPKREGSVHLESFPVPDKAWRNDELAKKWDLVRDVRRVVTGALELERAAKRIGSSLEAAPEVYVANKDLLRALEGDHQRGEVDRQVTAGRCLHAARRAGRRRSGEAGAG